MSEIKWVVVLPYAQAEWQVYTGLLRQGIRSFLPYSVSGSRRGRWMQGIVRAQYPGYLFAALEEGQSVESIKRIVGVREILKNEKGLVFITAEQIADCRKKWLVEYRKTAPRLIRRPRVSPGDWLPTPSGPMVGLPCQVQSIDKSGTIVASLGTWQVTFHLSAVSEYAVRGSAKPAKLLNVSAHR